eukprot:13468272-Ditylum_brightwellii.AAC.1
MEQKLVSDQLHNLSTCFLEIMCASFFPCVEAIMVVGVFTLESSVSAFSNIPAAKCHAHLSPHSGPIPPVCEAKFEKKWATCKPHLATLDGFKYFHLM